MAVVHSHSPAVVPSGGVGGVPLRPICRACGFLGRGAPVFGTRDCAGDSSDLPIRDRRLGAALARSLGQDAAVLIRGHGSAVVGARLQSEALRLGAVTYLTEGEAAAAAAVNDTQIGRAWDLWRRKVG